MIPSMNVCLIMIPSMNVYSKLDDVAGWCTENDCGANVKINVKLVSLFQMIQRLIFKCVHFKYLF